MEIVCVIAHDALEREDTSWQPKVIGSREGGGVSWWSSHCMEAPVPHKTGGVDGS